MAFKTVCKKSQLLNFFPEPPRFEERQDSLNYYYKFKHDYIKIDFGNPLRFALELIDGIEQVCTECIRETKYLNHELINLFPEETPFHVVYSYLIKNKSCLYCHNKNLKISYLFKNISKEEYKKIITKQKNISIKENIVQTKIISDDNDFGVSIFSKKEIENLKNKIK